MQPASHAPCSPLGSTDQAPQPARRTAQAERAERLRDYLALQLLFAEAVATTTAISLDAAVAQCTNFYRRFGLGRWHDGSIAPAWHTYTSHLLTLPTPAQRLAWTQAFLAQSPPEPLPPGQQQFGCFACDPPDAEGRVRIHFTNRDSDGSSPLSRSKMGQRQQDLQTMFTYVQHTYGEAARSVLGGSWLYHLEAYRRLFPAIYGESRTVIEGTEQFRGTSRWGQFLDHRERVKPDLRAQFLHNLGTLDRQRLWAAFPLPTYQTQAPIQAFYDFYQITTRTA
ncbi:MAG: hypothetical protein AB7N91_17325 [Candidatus Tectimicrobiota bacterium]